MSFQEVSSGLRQPTDIQPFPNDSAYLIIAEKEGALARVSLQNGEKLRFFSLKVETSSEQGLLGFVFHPQFKKNKKIYLNYSTRQSNGIKSRITRISEWRMENWAVKDERILLEIPQPYPNHNAGQLAFGPDGYLYIGLGDGGAAADPHNHGQDRRTLLGSMLRIDVNRVETSRPYGIPKDNPYVNNPRFRPEIWAYGLRNPWRYSFDTQGRLIAGDVGQNAWEEITFVSKGANLGWRIKESFHCFSPQLGCRDQGLTDPIVEYSHDHGQSVTGGYVLQGAAPADVQGHYFFGDFVSGGIWSFSPPQGTPSRPVSVRKWKKTDFSISTFGRDESGQLFLADFGKGRLFKLIFKSPSF